MIGISAANCTGGAICSVDVDIRLKNVNGKVAEVMDHTVKVRNVSMGMTADGNGTSNIQPGPAP